MKTFFCLVLILKFVEIRVKHILRVVQTHEFQLKNFSCPPHPVTQSWRRACCPAVHVPTVTARYHACDNKPTQLDVAIFIWIREKNSTIEHSGKANLNFRQLFEQDLVASILSRS